MSDFPEIRIGDGSGNELYRTCPQCGRDCGPEPFEAGKGDGLRISFNCPVHGVHTVIDPLEDSR